MDRIALCEVYAVLAHDYGRLGVRIGAREEKGGSMTWTETDTAILAASGRYISPWPDEYDDCLRLARRVVEFVTKAGYTLTDNARLIAAGPDLLEAAKLALPWLTVDPSVARTVRSAIAKAEGQPDEAELRRRAERNRNIRRGMGRTV